MASSTASRKRSGESPRRSAGGGAGEDAGGHELGDGADGRTRRVRRNLLEGAAVAAVGHVVDLEHLAGDPGPVAVPPPVRPGVVEAAAALGLGAPLAEGRGVDAPVGDGLGEDAPDGGDGQRQPVPGRHRAQLGLAHVGVLPAQLGTARSSASVQRRRRAVRGRVLLGLSARTPPRRKALRQSWQVLLAKPAVRRASPRRMPPATIRSMSSRARRRTEGSSSRSYASRRRLQEGGQACNSFMLRLLVQ